MNSSGSGRRGFTLVEFLAVLLLSLLLVGTAVVCFRSPRRDADLAAAQSRLETLDQRARIEAKRNGGARLTIDASSNQISVHRLVPQVMLLCTCQMPGEISLLDPAAAGPPTSRGPRVVEYDANGRSPSFGIGFGTPSSRQVQWLLFTGDVGQSCMFDKREDLHAILDSVSEARTYAP